MRSSESKRLPCRERPRWRSAAGDVHPRNATERNAPERTATEGVPYTTWLIAAALIVSLPGGAVAQPAPAELDANRRRFEQLQKNPEQLAKLRAEAAAFFGLSEGRQQQIVEIDRALQQEPAPVQRRLAEVLDRYLEWLNGQDEATRKKIADAPDKNARLALIKELREKEWRQDQPKATQDELRDLKGEAYVRRVAELKRGERQRKLEWLMARRFWNELETKQRLPIKIEELPQTLREPVRDYVRDYVLPQLTPAEKERLEQAKGQWPLFPMTLVELADRYPPALPRPQGPRTFAELPADVLKKCSAAAPKFKKDVVPPAMLARLFKVREGKWPEFGITLAEAAEHKGLIFDHEFLAYRKDCLQPPMQEFVDKKLLPLLDGAQKIRLGEAIGRWPDYPQAIQELAEQHGLTPPWYTFPRPDYWRRYRLRDTADGPR
jgi:hypothetical protein